MDGLASGEDLALGEDVRVQALLSLGGSGVSLNHVLEGVISELFQTLLEGDNFISIGLRRLGTTKLSFFIAGHVLIQLAFGAGDVRHRLLGGDSGAVLDSC